MCSLYDRFFGRGGRGWHAGFFWVLGGGGYATYQPQGRDQSAPSHDNGPGSSSRFGQANKRTFRPETNGGATRSGLFNWLLCCDLSFVDVMPRRFVYVVPRRLLMLYSFYTVVCFVVVHFFSPARASLREPLCCSPLSSRTQTRKRLPAG